MSAATIIVLTKNSVEGNWIMIRFLNFGLDFYDRSIIVYALESYLLFQLSWIFMFADILRIWSKVKSSQVSLALEKA